jgi:hypothetical protein
VLQVAGLRGIEVGIGVLTGVAVSLVLRGVGAAARFDTACAALLRRYAAMLEPGDRAIAADTEIRSKLRELAVLAAGADTEARWLHRERSADRHRKLAGLMARLFQDVAVLARLVPAEPTRKAALSALEDAAGAWERRSPLATTPLEDADPTTAGPLRLLVDELRLLVRLRAR